jgi:hypothetical protein
MSSAPFGLVPPGCLAIVQQFLRGRSVSSPSTNARAWRLGSTRGNRRANPAHHLLEQHLPPGRVNLDAVACGHRPIFGCVHNTGSSTVAALLRSPAPPLTSQVTNSGWSTKDLSG